MRQTETERDRDRGREIETDRQTDKEETNKAKRKGDGKTRFAFRYVIISKEQIPSQIIDQIPYTQTFSIIGIVWQTGNEADISNKNYVVRTISFVGI